MIPWPAGAHLGAIYAALYAGLGEGAPRVSVDAFVVRLHEMSRAFGELALEMRGDVDVAPEPDPLVSAVLANSLAEDASGALSLYAVAMVIGPRLLVTLRDYLSEETDEDRRSRLSHASDVVVAEIRAVGATVGRHPALEDPAWADAARALIDVFDGVGMAESLGQRH